MEKEVSTIYKELSQKVIPLENIFLDPNNPRFTSLDWNEVANDRIDDPIIQKAVQHKLIDNFSIDRLLMNIETNGFLVIDRVVVKEFKKDKFVVLEGNRRICAAKVLNQRFIENPTSVNEEVVESFQNIDSLVYTGTDQQPAWILQGLRHIMGVQDWSSFNKAKLLVQLMEDEELTLTEVGRKFGLTAFGAGQWVRGYYAFKRACEETDYTREVDEKAYPYFQEIFSRSNTAFREWLKWNDTDYKFEDELHFNEFLSWLYPRNDEDTLDGADVRGDWSLKKLSKRDDIRIISHLIREFPMEFESFRVDGNLEKAYNIANTKKILSQANPSEDAFSNIEACIKSLENLPFKLIKSEKEKLIGLLTKLTKAIEDIREACQ